MIINFTDITDRKMAELALLHQSLHDTLTGLPNRSLLADRLEVALLRAERDGVPVGAILLDVDQFQLVNDGLGHQADDR